MDGFAGFAVFAGPLIMDMDGRWLSTNFNQLQIKIDGKNVPLDDTIVKSSYYPGTLTQVINLPLVRITLQIIFVSNRQALLQTQVVNTSKKRINIGLIYTGCLLLKEAFISKNNQEIVVDLHNNNQFYIRYSDQDKYHIRLSANGYTANHQPFNLAPGEERNLIQEHGYYTKSEEKPKYFSTPFDQALFANEQRWNTWLSDYFTHTNIKDQKYKKLAVKSIITLITNWRSPFKNLYHDGLFPSVSYQGFYGVWSWDSWKQAVGLSLFNPWLAQENIRCMFDYQDRYGMIADCIYADKSENNWRDTKPPLASWAVWETYRQSSDSRFLNEIYPKLVSYHHWWYKNRDHDQNGLCEYGSTDGSRIAAAWESGMDNAVRFDNAVMVKNNDYAWSLNQESVDLNSYLYADKLYLHKIATVLNLTEEAKQWSIEATSLRDKINQRFYDSENGYYYDRLISSMDPIKVEGPEGWIPLWAGIADTLMASSVKSIMADSAKFNTKVPLPTLAADHPKFNPKNGYWRGPVWLDQFYFGVNGLKRYGHTDLCNDMIYKFYNSAEGLFADKPIYENYHPITGAALNAPNFSWSAAHILMLLNDFSQ